MFPESLTALTAQFGNNQSGICKAFVVNKEKTSGMWTIADIMKRTDDPPLYPLNGLWIGLAIGTNWLKLTQYDNTEMEFTETEEDTAQGKRFNYTLAFRMQNDDYTTRGKILQAFDNREWIGIVKERSGANRVIGSAERGCDFKANFGTGKVIGGSNLYAGAFVWQSSYRALYVSDAYVTAIS